MTVTYVPLRDGEERGSRHTPQTGRRFYQCRLCGCWVDSTDIRQVALHDDQPPPPGRAIQSEWPPDKFL